MRRLLIPILAFVLLTALLADYPAGKGFAQSHSTIRRLTTRSDAASTPALIWARPTLPAQYAAARVGSVAFDSATSGTALASIGFFGDAMLRTNDHGMTWSTLPGWATSDTRFGFGIVYGERPGVYYAMGGTQVYSTTNSGDSWAQVPYNTLCNMIVTLIVHPTQPNILYAGTTNGFVRSVDGGQTWDFPIETPCTDGPRAYTIAAGSDQPNIVYVGLYYNYGGGVQRSADQGKTWTPANTGLPTIQNGQFVASITQLIVDPRNASVVFAHVEDGGIYKTTDGGTQWAPVSQGIEGIAIESLLLESSSYTLYGVSGSQIYTLADGASAWQLQPSTPVPPITAFPPSHGLALDPTLNNRLILYGMNGLYIGLPIRGRVALPLVAR